MFCRKLISFVIVIFFFLCLTKTSFASTLYLSPGKTNVGIGSVTYVRVILNTAGESVNGVSAYLSYPADKLEVSGISYGGSFNIAAEGSYGGGGIRISRGSMSGVSGAVTVATIGFRGKSLGTAGVSFIGGSAAPRTSDSSDSLSGTSGGTYTIVKGVPQPTQRPGTKTQITVVPTPKDTSLPEIGNIKILSVSTNNAEISWDTNEKTKTVIEYGLEKNKYFASFVDNNLVTNHKIKLESPLFTPGAKIHFRILAKDQSDNPGTGNDIEFQLKGYTVTVKVSDEKNKVIKNAEVLLYSRSQKAMTNSEGSAIFQNVTLGTHIIVVKIGGIEKTKEIEIIDSSIPQNFTVSFDTKLLSKNRLPDAIVLSVLTLVLGGVLFIFYKSKKRKVQPQNNSSETYIKPS